MTTPRAIITTSWDDGHVLDLRLAKLLRRYRIPATLYVSPQDHEFSADQRLTDAQVAQLANDFEIGAHTMTHPRLTEVSDERARQEMADSKAYLERIVGRPVTSFCYPGGNYRPAHTRLAHDVGFTYARTCHRHATGPGRSWLEAATTVNAYNHYQDLYKIWRFAKFNPLKVPHYFAWNELAKARFDQVRREGGVFHLWGHSWEIDQHGDWDKLEDVLRYISGHTDVTYATNGQLTALIKPKLLLAAPYFPPNTGGVEHYASTMAHGAAAAGLAVEVVTSGHVGQRGVVRENHNGLTVWRLPVNFRVMNTPIGWGWYWHIRRIINQFDPDIVNVHAPVAYLPDLTLLAARGRRRITTYHAGPMRKGRAGADWLIGLYEDVFLPYLYRAADQIICPSDYVRQRLRAGAKAKAGVISPGVDLKEFPRRSSHTPGRRVVFVGHYRNGLKGVQHLVSAVQALPGTTLHIVGDGPQPPTSQVVYHGVLHGQSLVEQLQAADVLVLPSVGTESFGMVIIEAMACGVPVIASRYGGIPEIITDDVTGRLVPPGDAVALRQALSGLLDHPDTAQRLANQAFTLVNRQFTWEVSLAKYLTVLQTLWEQPR